jgi:hypothetical protein
MQQATVSDDYSDHSNSDRTGGMDVSIGPQRRNRFAAPLAWLLLTPLSLALGGLLCASAFALLAFNEVTGAVRAGSLARGAQLAVTVSADQVDPAREGDLVHVAGLAVAHGEVVDPETGFSASGTQLLRSAEMLQWVERRIIEVVSDSAEGEEVITRYNYDPQWVKSWQDSGRFQGSQPPSNPPSMPYLNEGWLAEHVTVGAFRLRPWQIKRIGKPEPLDLSSFSPTRQVAGGTLVRHGNTYYLGRNPAQPQIGDIRISYSILRPGPVTILAAQSGTSFTTYKVSVPLPAARSLVNLLSPGSSEIDVLRNGTVPIEAMLSGEQRHRVLQTWALRVVGALVMVIGLKFVLWAGSGLLSVMPKVRRFFPQGKGFVSLRLGLGLSVITCVFAWVAARGLADERLAQHGASAAALILLVWVASEPLRSRYASERGRAWRGPNRG